MNKKILAFIYNGKKFLALRNNSKDSSHGGDFWFTVTGSLEKGESEKDAVKREVKEETGLKVLDIFDLNCGSIYKWNNKSYEETNFIAFVKSEDVELNEEHTEYKWLNLDEFIKIIKWYLDKEELKKILNKAIRKEVFFKEKKIEDFRKK